MADQHHHLTVLDDESEAETLISPPEGSHVGGCAQGFPMTFQQLKAVITNSLPLTHKTRSYYFFHTQCGYMGASTMCLRFLYLHCYCTTLLCWSKSRLWEDETVLALDGSTRWGPRQCS